MKKIELIQKLNRQGAVFLRRGGKHDVYMQPKTKEERKGKREKRKNSSRRERRGAEENEQLVVRSEKWKTTRLKGDCHLQPPFFLLLIARR